MQSKIIIGSRGSELALWQAHFVERQLKDLGCEVVIKVIKTQGDQIQHLSFDKMEGKGFFTKEIEEALLNKEIDLAVHSFKDLETAKVEGLQITAVSYRENPSDVLLIRKTAVDETKVLSLKDNALVGTSSARRKAQLHGFRTDLQIKDLRGNVPTRIQKLKDGFYDAIMLAQAGINRLEIDLSEFFVKSLEPQFFIPAPAQGVLGLQTRSNDESTNSIVKQLNHPEIKDSISLERAVLQSFNGGCQLPLGVYCEKQNNSYEIWAALGQADGTVSRFNEIFSTTDKLVETVVNGLKKKALN